MTFDFSAFKTSLRLTNLGHNHINGRLQICQAQCSSPVSRGRRWRASREWERCWSPGSRLPRSGGRCSRPHRPSPRGSPPRCPCRYAPSRPVGRGRGDIRKQKQRACRQIQKGTRESEKTKSKQWQSCGWLVTKKYYSVLALMCNK